MCRAIASIFFAALLASAARSVRADEGCVDFKWDTVKEHALFSGKAESLNLGADQKSAPMIELQHLYVLHPLPQDRVSLAAAPRTEPPVGAKAGLATFKIPAAGNYRVSVDAPFWIDVVSNGARVVAKDYQGQHGCSAPNKIVEYDLLGSHPFVLQLSNATAASVRLTITPTPERKL